MAGETSRGVKHNHAFDVIFPYLVNSLYSIVLRPHCQKPKYNLSTKEECVSFEKDFNMPRGTGEYQYQRQAASYISLKKKQQQQQQQQQQNTIARATQKTGRESVAHPGTPLTPSWILIGRANRQRRPKFATSEDEMRNCSFPPFLGNIW